MKKKPTLHDVASAAGVSIATVSNVLNSKKNEVTEKTTIKVLKAISQLGYSPNEYARGLKKGKSRVVGLIIPDQNPFFTEILKGVSEQCDVYGWQVMVASSEESEERQNQLVDIFISQQVNGIILGPTGTSLPRNDFPVVLIDREIEGSFLPSISAANVEGCWKATEKLILNGHEKISIILGPPDISTTNQRRIGYEKALQANGIAINQDFICYGEEYKGTQSQINIGYESVCKLLELRVPPTAVIAGNHLLMLGALKAFKEKGVKIPEELAFIGFDDHPWNEINSPSITVIAQPAYEMGKQASMILKKLAEDELIMQSIKLPMDLVIRESCGTVRNKVF